MSDPDQALMRAFQEGDVSAFEVLVHKYQGPVLSLVRRYLGSRSPGVEDVGQEVFLRIYRGKHTYEPKAKVGTWIYRITVNTCLNEIRRLGAEKNRRVAGFTAVFGGGAGGDAGASAEEVLADPRAEAPADAAQGTEVAQRVRRAVDALPEQQRLALVLARYHHLSCEDVAASMGTTTPAVKSLLMRARDNLRRALAGLVSGGEGAGLAAARGDDDDA